jgi:hypothetical protein
MLFSKQNIRHANQAVGMLFFNQYLQVFHKYQCVEKGIAI